LTHPPNDFRAWEKMRLENRGLDVKKSG